MDMTSRLRRKRSLASAALTSRPSVLTLGRLTPSLETCVLIHTTSKVAPTSSATAETGAPPASTAAAAPGSRQLVHALFEPNFFVDGVKKRVERLDRAQWERIRASVEDLRIVGIASRERRINPTAPPLTPAKNPGGLITPEASPTKEEGRVGSSSGGGGGGATMRAPDCLFDLIAPSSVVDPGAASSSSGSASSGMASPADASRSISTLLIQPRSYTALPASAADELIEFEIRGVGDGILAAHRWDILPDQVKRILEEAERLGEPSDDHLLKSLQDASLRDSGKGYSEDECQSICEQILGLVSARW
ncbi:uncharacterized protein PFL1_00612 [Pseudozyma flocculosa PF-1]|nr:uncharacterized protein PFL1_00612 [Pseudozyma flocculosa PF-1]EPQ32416.1 hypothetical protein PFL1_00612 [Pseudozyma flocculosa PF-1]